MDSEGFVPNGLAPPRTASARRTSSRADTAKGTVFTGNKIVHEKPDAETRTIGFLRGVQSVTGFTWFAQMLTIPVFGIAWLLSAVGLKQAGFSLRRWINAPATALFKVPVAEAGTFRAVSTELAADMARESKHAPINAQSKGLDAKAQTLRQNAKPSTFMQGARARVGAWLDKRNSDGWFSKRVRGFTEWRHAKHAPKVDKAVDALHEQVGAIVKQPEALAAEAQKSGKAVDQAAHAAATESKKLFQPVFDLLAKAKAEKNPALRAQLLHQAEEAAANAAKNLTGKAAKEVHGIRDAIGAAKQSATTLMHHAEALKGGLRGQVKNLLRIGGRIPIAYAIIGAGVAVGAVGTALAAKRENRQSKQALQDMKADIGDENHPIIKEASKLEKKQHSRRWIGAGLSTVGDGVYLAPANGTVGIMAVMAGSQLAQVGQMIMPENRSLAAYTMLKKAEAGKVQLDPKNKLELLRHLVTAVPAFAKQGGVDNRLAAPVAAEIAKCEMSVRDTMRFLASPDQFMEVVNRVAAEQKKIDDAAAAEKAAAEKAASEKAAAEKAKTGVATPAPEKPAMTIAGAKGTAQGRIVEQSRAMGQV